MIIDNLLSSSYEPDMAELIDTEEEILADRYNVSLKVSRMIINDHKNKGTIEAALILGNVIGLLMKSNNQEVMVNALAIAAGMDQLNGAKSEQQIADELGISRALLSHYVVGWRDSLSGKQYQFDITKIRKNNSTRETYAKQATCPVLEDKRQKRKLIAKRMRDTLNTNKQKNNATNHNTN
jgi:predicted transcriptional regulator